MSFTERDVTVLRAELKAVCRRGRKLIMVRKIVATHRQEKMNHLRVLEKCAVWRKNGLDRCNVHHGQWRPWSHGHVSSRNDPKHSQTNVNSDCRRLPTPRKTTGSMWAELNVLK